MNVFEQIKQKCLKNSQIGRSSFAEFLKILDEVEKEHSQTNAWQEVYNKVLQLEQDYAENGDTETVSDCIKLENLLNYFKDELYKTTNNGWIPVEEKLPEQGKYILLSFSNFSVPVVGRWEENDYAGAFYIGDETETCVSQMLFVNAWMELPEQYKESEGEC